MSKLFVLLVLALSLILTHTCSAGPTQLSTRGVDGDNDESGSSDEADSGSEADSDEDDNEDEIEDNPAPSCLLFGDQACHIECAVIAQVYDIEADGHCDLHQTCQCHISNTVSFKDAWKKKFHTGYVYRKITHNEMLLEQAHRIFNYPLRTADQFKQLFKPVISPYQFSKLETDDESLAAKFTKKDDSIDIPAVEKYVSEEVGKLLKSSNDSLLTEKYKEKFTKALENSKDSEGTLHNLIFRVRQLKNKSLEEAVEAYLKKNNVKEPEVELTEKEGLPEILTNAITNEIIKQNDEKNKPAKVAAKKPVAKKPVASKAAPAGKRGPRFQTPKKSSS